MKGITLILTLLILSPLAAQNTEFAEYQNYVTRTGLILEITDSKINFEEMWLDLVPHGAKRNMPVTISDIAGNPISLSDLEAPCLVDLTYEERDEQIIPVEIKLIKQYQYNSDGFITEDSH